MIQDSFVLLTLQGIFFVVMVEMSNCTGLARLQERHMGPVCFFGSAVNMEVQSGCGQVNVGLFQ